LIRETPGEAMTTLRWTSRDLEPLPDDGKRYEIVDGELYVSKQPHLLHQFVCGQILEFLQVWSRRTKAGWAFFAPGLIFADDDDVAPDVIRISRERLAIALRPDGYLHSAPELAIEELSMISPADWVPGPPQGFWMKGSISLWQIQPLHD
jgi:Uma2 family endonuclease